MKKLISALLSTIFILSLAAAPVFPAEANGVRNEVYRFLTDELGLNSAAAAGVMANIMCESSFNPAAGAIDTNGLYSYGLVMWNGPRYERLKTWCELHDLPYSSVKGQMGYLKYELENTERGTLEAMKTIPDTLEGCVNAAVLFAELFERCAAFSYGLRTHYAVNDFWPAYGAGAATGNPGIYGVYCNYPVTVRTGESFYLKGAVVSYTSPLTEVTAGIYDGEGNMLTGATLEPDAYCLDVTKIDKYVVFGILGPGEYTYEITAKNADGFYTVEKHGFTVGDAASTGKYPRITAGIISCGFGSFCPGAKFADMPSEKNWAHEGIDFVLSRELFLGTSERKFSPDETMTRAMLVTVLHRLAGKPEPSYGSESETVDPDEEIASSEQTSFEASAQSEEAAAVEAPKKSAAGLTGNERAEGTIEAADVEEIVLGIGRIIESEETAGTGDVSFPLEGEDAEPPEESGDGPGDDPVDPKPSGPKKFTDVPYWSWFAPAVAWASSVGIIEGTDEEHFSPYSHVTREQLATILFRYTVFAGLDSGERADTEPFPDAYTVSPWAEEALAWAVAAGVIRGNRTPRGDLIDPSASATRAQVAVMCKRFCETVIGE